MTNKTYIINTGGGYISAGVGDAAINQPRMYGLRLRYAYGR